MLCQNKPRERLTNQESEYIYNIQNFYWGRESHNVCFRRSENFQPVGFKPRLEKLTKNTHKGRPSS